MIPAPASNSDWIPPAKNIIPRNSSPADQSPALSTICKTKPAKQIAPRISPTHNSAAPTILATKSSPADDFTFGPFFLGRVTFGVFLSGTPHRKAADVNEHSSQTIFPSDVFSILSPRKTSAPHSGHCIPIPPIHDSFSNQHPHQPPIIHPHPTPRKTNSLSPLPCCR